MISFERDRPTSASRLSTNGAIIPLSSPRPPSAVSYASLSSARSVSSSSTLQLPTGSPGLGRESRVGSAGSTGSVSSRRSGKVLTIGQKPQRSSDRFLPAPGTASEKEKEHRSASDNPKR